MSELVTEALYFSLFAGLFKMAITQTNGGRDVANNDPSKERCIRRTTLEIPIMFIRELRVLIGQYLADAERRRRLDEHHVQTPEQSGNVLPSTTRCEGEQ